LCTGSIVVLILSAGARGAIALFDLEVWRRPGCSKDFARDASVTFVAGDFTVLPNPVYID
jgi:hypothetical protein